MFEQGFENFIVLSQKFESFHKDPVNVFLHFLTTPLGLIGFLGFLRYFLSRNTMIILSTCYIICLLPVVNSEVFIGSALLWGVITFFGLLGNSNLVYSVILILIGYFGQDLSHYLTSEKTFQSSYTKSEFEVDFNSGWLMTFLEHTFFLVPLCIHVVLPFCKLEVLFRHTITNVSALTYFLNLTFLEQLFVIIPTLVAIGVYRSKLF